MYERELKLFRFMCRYLQKVTADIADDDFRKTLPGLLNPPAHVVGHLAVTNDSLLKILGQATVCPPQWHQLFGMNAQPLTADQYPDKASLLACFDAGRAAIEAAAPSADPAVLDHPHSIAPLQGTGLETIGDLVAMLLTTHLSLHVGQLSLMRRQLGHPPLL
jgi:uncharacterized damage-inducible protein DinB